MDVATNIIGADATALRADIPSTSSIHSTSGKGGQVLDITPQHPNGHDQFLRQINYEILKQWVVCNAARALVDAACIVAYRTCS